MSTRPSQQIATALDETRRHFDVVAEGLRADMRLLAEGLAGSREEMQVFRSEVAAEFAEVRSLLKLSYADLDRRVSTLERAAPPQRPR